MSISTSSNHSESRTPPAMEVEETIHNQLSGIAHALLTRQPVRVQQLMALHNDKEEYADDIVILVSDNFNTTVPELSTDAVNMVGKWCHGISLSVNLICPDGLLQHQRDRQQTSNHQTVLEFVEVLSCQHLTVVSTSFPGHYHSGYMAMRSAYCLQQTGLQQGHSKISILIQENALHMISDQIPERCSYDKLNPSGLKPLPPAEPEWFMDGSKTKRGTGAGTMGVSSCRDLVVPVGSYPTVLQAEVTAIMKCVRENLSPAGPGSTEGVVSKLMFEIAIKLFLPLAISTIVDALASLGSASNVTGSQPLCGIFGFDPLGLSEIGVFSGYRSDHGTWSPENASYRVGILWEDPLCRKCDEQKETAEHLLFHCPATAKERCAIFGSLDKDGEFPQEDLIGCFQRTDGSLGLRQLVLLVGRTIVRIIAASLHKSIDQMTYQLTDSLRTELRQAASSSSVKPHKLDPKQHVFYPQVSGDGWSGGEGGFDAHAVYAGDNAVSASNRTSLATEGVRSTLAALLTRYNYPAAAQSLHTGPGGRFLDVRKSR
ncbi:Cyclin-dependent kinase 12 [Homalodisca vitripennis]|nr:Cyclin-dependent kinase 12 [Homalodisca vitripennis]